MEERGGPPLDAPWPSPVDRHSSAHMLDNTAVEVKLGEEAPSSPVMEQQDKQDRQDNPSTPPLTPLHSHTGRTPLHLQSKFSTRSSFSSPGTPHISNQRYTTPLEGSTMGNVLAKYPALMWIVCCLTPLAYLLLVFGAIPIGERRDDDDDHTPGRAADTNRFHRYWIFTCVVNPLNMTVIAFLNCGIFLSCMGVMRPFRVHWSILITVFVTEVVVFTVIVPFIGTFDFFGVASLFLGYISTFVGMAPLPILIHPSNIISVVQLPSTSSLSLTHRLSCSINVFSPLSYSNLLLRDMEGGESVQGNAPGAC